MRRWLAVILIVASWTGAPLAHADHRGIRGEVVDLVAYFRAAASQNDEVPPQSSSSGALAIKDQDSGTLYLLLPEGSQDDLHLADYLGRRVEVTGHIMERGGIQALVAGSVELVSH